MNALFDSNVLATAPADSPLFGSRSAKQWYDMLLVLLHDSQNWNYPTLRTASVPTRQPTKIQ